MAFTVELPDNLHDRLDALLEEAETYPELIEELVNIHESRRFVQKGYSERRRLPAVHGSTDTGCRCARRREADAQRHDRSTPNSRHR